MSKDNLALLVTGLGVVLCVSLIAIVLLGKRISSDGDGPQELEFKGLRAKTNVIIMFLIVSLVPAVLPLYLAQSAATTIPEVTMFETWRVRGHILADNADESSMLIQPEQTKVNINPDGSFFVDIPVMRGADGKLNFPSLIIDNAKHRREILDLDGLQHGSTYGARDFGAEFASPNRSIVLKKPIQLVRKKSDTNLGPTAGGTLQ